MRIIDADKLYPDCMTKNGTLAISQSQIANAPTVEITEEQAMEKLHETGWMQRHDKEMTERPTGKYTYADGYLQGYIDGSTGTDWRMIEE